MAIKSIDLAWITVKDMKKAKSFFVETLGMEIAESNENYNWLELKGFKGGMTLGVAEAHDECSDEKPGSNAVVTLSVDDIVKTKKELELKGVKFVGEILEVPHHVKMVTFLDFDGNKFQLAEDISKK